MTLPSRQLLFSPNLTRYGKTACLLLAVAATPLQAASAQGTPAQQLPAATAQQNLQLATNSAYRKTLERWINQHSVPPATCGDNPCPPDQIILMLKLDKNGQLHQAQVREVSDTYALNTTVLEPFKQTSLPALPASFPDILYTLRILAQYPRGSTVTHSMKAHYVLIPTPESPNLIETDPDYKNILNAWIKARFYYPEEAARGGEEGLCGVHVVMDRAGQVQNVTVVASSGSYYLDAATRGLFVHAHLPPVPHGKHRYYNFDIGITYRLKTQNPTLNSGSQKPAAPQ